MLRFSNAVSAGYLTKKTRIRDNIFMKYEILKFSIFERTFCHFSSMRNDIFCEGRSSKKWKQLRLVPYQQHVPL